jgi:arylformamidase
LLVDVSIAGAVKGGALDRLDLPAATTRLLLRTPEASALDECGARWLVARGIKLVGIDGLSIGVSDQSDAVHRTLLDSGVVIVESLNLADVPPGQYQLICLPLNLTGAEAAPVRAILIG